MSIENIETRLIQRKVCLLGEYAVGKTSLVRQFVEGRFDDRYLSTIGVKISRKSMTLVNRPYNLLIWDLADGETYRVASNYLRGAAGAVVVCDITRESTLQTLMTYVGYLRVHLRSISIVVAVNKIDLIEQRAVSETDLQLLEASVGAPFIMTSAKAGTGVEEAFTHLVNLMESVL